MSKTPHPRDPIDHDQTTMYSQTIRTPFLTAVKNYGMALPGDKIAVCLSGGKDSLLLAKCMQVLKKYSKVPFELDFISMDPGYSEQNRQGVLDAAAMLGIEPYVFETDIYSIVDTVATSPCHVCASMRRGHLYKQAKLRGCNKIALGHHRDDAAETILLSILYGGQFKAMLPKLKSEYFEGMELVRPLYLVREKAVRAWLASTGIRTITCVCRVTKSEDGGKRARVKRLLKELEEERSNIIDNIIASSENVNLATLLSYKEDESEDSVSFLEKFNAPGHAGINQVDRLF